METRGRDFDASRAGGGVKIQLEEPIQAGHPIPIPTDPYLEDRGCYRIFRTISKRQ